MEDFSQLCLALQSKYNARSIPFSLSDYVRMCLESLADLISEERPEQFHSAMARFFAALYGGNELFNGLPVPSRNNLNSVTIGIPPRRLFELLNDFARAINEISLLEMSSKTVRSSLQKNGFPYRPNEFFSLLEQFERLDQSFTETTGRHLQLAANEQTGVRKSSSVDHKRLAFYEAQKLTQPTLRYKKAAELWCKKFKDICDENAFKQSCHRARKSNKT